MNLKEKISRIRFEIWEPTTAEWKELAQDAKLLQQFIDECNKAIRDCEQTIRITWDQYADLRRRSLEKPELKEKVKQLELYMKQKDNEIDLLLDLVEQAKELLWEVE